ncbi:MAG TPA: protein phosphatase [Candidatus Avipropionibacterium avicola]|uniref:Protein phosphatase n=1 Tax=Candidatus Avipropionibacterium avicola TaxID=2840701 RepID=A0A9D1GVN4_9ACTN|nr:protein phosphatase [Candidatus Avipropionibacterium avicola]
MVTPMHLWPSGEGIVEFPDGRRCRGRGLRRPLPDGPDPDFGVYLLGREPAAQRWASRWVRWRDFRLPDSTADALTALREAYDRAATERVEIACGGGVGRTGTALAVLAVMGGIAADDSVTWVRQQYHRRAVETRRQRRWIQQVAGQQD